MDAAGFRRLALVLPEAVEAAHQGHPDFRVRGKIFATLHTDGVWGVVMLTAEQQAARIAEAPDVWVPATGAWGRRGATLVKLRSVRLAALREAIDLAWHNKAPKRLQGD